MRKERKPGRTQPALFQPPAITPAWQSLPPEARQRVQALLIQLLREARDSHRPPQRKEAGDE